MKKAVLALILAAITVGCGPVAPSVSKTSPTAFRVWTSVSEYDLDGSGSLSKVSLDFTGLSLGLAKVTGGPLNCSCLVSGNRLQRSGTFTFDYCSPSADCSGLQTAFSGASYEVLDFNSMKISLPAVSSPDNLFE